jgi:hypothetical protein
MSTTKNFWGNMYTNHNDARARLAVPCYAEMLTQSTPQLRRKDDEGLVTTFIFNLTA